MTSQAKLLLVNGAHSSIARDPHHVHLQLVINLGRDTWPPASGHTQRATVTLRTTLKAPSDAISIRLLCRSLRRRLSFLAALAAPAAPDAACPPQPINRLALRCYLPLSAAVAEALLAACPRVSDLTIITFDEEDVHSAAYGIMQLLSGYGPQLQLLHLRPRPLPPLALYSLSACTGLVRLELAHNEFPASGVLAGTC